LCQPDELTSQLLHGRPAFAIVREVVQHGFDLVIKDAHGTKKDKTLLFGPIDMRLLRNCPCLCRTSGCSNTSRKITT
jgi:hypothetical protein